MSDIVTPLYILLPICMETKHDVFFNIVKTIIARSKVEEHYLDNALKVGLKGEKFLIELEDITTNWAELVSQEQQIRQSMILGYWAIEHFPSLGKKMHGQSWKPPTRECFRIDENSREIVLSEVDIDAIVFKKLKLRLYEVNLSKSTSAKLKRFIIDPPIYVGKYNECQISPKVKSFDIEGNFWEALKLGTFSSEFNFEERVDVNPTVQPESQPQPPPQREIEFHSRNGSQSLLSRKRAHHCTEINGQTGKNSTSEPINGSQTVSVQKRAALDTLTIATINDETVESNSRKPSIVSSASDRAYFDDVNNGATVEMRNGKASIDTIHAEVVGLRKEIVNLQMMIINPRDEEISRLNSAIQELQQANENLMADKLMLKDQVGKQTSLIYALQQGVEATSTLHNQSERDVAKKHEELDSIKKAYQQLHDDLNQLNISTAGMASEWKIHVEKLEADLSTAEKMNSEADEKITKLQDELNVSQTNSASKDEQLNDALTTLNELRVQIEFLSPAKTDIQTQTTACNESEELSELKTMLTGKDEELDSIKKAYQQLHDDLNQLNISTAGMASEWKIHVEKLEAGLSTAEKMNSEADEKITKLQDELNVSQTNSASKDEQLNDALTTLNELRVQIEFLSPAKTDIQTQTTACNESEEELSGLKTMLAGKDEELDSIKKAYQQLHDDLNQLNISTAGMASEWKVHVEKLEAGLSTAEKMNSEADEKITKLQDELNVSQMNSASKDEQLNGALTNMNELRVQIEILSPAKTDMQTQTDSCNESDEVLSALKANLIEKDEELDSIKKAYQQLHDDSKQLSSSTAGMVKCKAHIESLEADLLTTKVNRVLEHAKIEPSTNMSNDHHSAPVGTVFTDLRRSRRRKNNL